MYSCEYGESKRCQARFRHAGKATIEGIDLVAETRDGEYWAIQAKYRTDPRRRLAFRDLSTFAALTYTTCEDPHEYSGKACGFY